MFAKLRRSLIFNFVLFAAATTALAQTTTLQGDVTDENGQPLKGAVIMLERTDIKGHYQVKSDKKGHWLYTGLPLGTFNISCEVNGQVVDKVTAVKSTYSGDSPPVNFDLQKAKQAHAAATKANDTGQLTQDQQHGMSADEKAKYEAQVKQRSESMKKNKALNDAFNAGQDAMKTSDYKTAVDQFTKAGDLDATQPAVWGSLGEAYAALAKTQTGEDKQKSYDAAIAAYQKSLAIKPNDAGVYNQIGNIYGAEKKIPEATDALTKAAQLDPAMASKAYFNMGANLVNTGQADKASEFFKKATDTDPNYAEAWYQLGSTSMMKGAVDPKTGQQSYPPDTAPALKKYLELQPSGPHAQEASAMLQAMGETVQTKVGVNATPTTSKKKKQ